jgi:valyl-tRNA synthetase
VHVLRRICKLLHPYCPFVTEELWTHIAPKHIPTLISSQWPLIKDERRDQKAFDDLQILIDVITAIRRLRAENDVEAGKEVSVTIVSKKYCKGLEAEQEHIRRMAKVDSLTITTDSILQKNSVSAFLSDIEVHLSLEGLFDPAKLKASLEKERADLTKYVAVLEGKLKNKAFTEKAPTELVDGEKAKLAEATERLMKIAERLKGL